MRVSLKGLLEFFSLPGGFSPGTSLVLPDEADPGTPDEIFPTCSAQPLGNKVTVLPVPEPEQGPLDLLLPAFRHMDRFPRFRVQTGVVHAG